MSMLSFETSLAWPAGRAQTPRARQRDDHGFPAMDLAEAIGYLDDELKELQASAAVLSLDIEQPLVPRLRKKTGSRTGACLRFKYSNLPYVLSCDQWQAIEHNIYALHLSLRQWRNIDRWGIGSLPTLLRSFEAVQSAAATSTGLAPWMAHLGLGPTATLEDAIAVYHRRARLAGQNTETLAQLNILMEEVRGYFTGKS